MSGHNWVTEWKKVEHYNETGNCVCGNNLDEDVLLGLRWVDYAHWMHCRECKRDYLIRNEDEKADVPEFFLHKHKDDGIYARGSEDASERVEYELLFLISIMGEVTDYVELYPFNYDDVYYMVESELVLAFLLAEDTEIQAVGVAPGYRGEGRGTEIVMKWAEDKNLDEIPVSGWFDRVEDFYRSLPLPVEDLSAD